MTARTQIVGQRGECIAEDHLTSLGARVLSRNYRADFGEIDLVLEHEGDLVAVEVKARGVADLEQPEEAVTWSQLRRIARALAAFALDTDRLEEPWRIDVVAISFAADGSVHSLDHLRSVYPG